LGLARGAAVDDAAADNSCPSGAYSMSVFQISFPRESVDRYGLVVAGDIHHAVFDKSLRLFTVIAGHAV